MKMYLVPHFYEFCKYVKNEIKNPLECRSIINHEGDHRRAGLKRGHIPKGFTLRINDDGSYIATTNFSENIPNKDLIFILLAPKNPSSEDWKMAEKAMKRYNKITWGEK